MPLTGRRQERLQDQIRSEVAVMISEELKDPRIGFATVTRVELSAGAYCSFLSFSSSASIFCPSSGPWSRTKVSSGARRRRNRRAISRRRYPAAADRPSRVLC